MKIILHMKSGKTIVVNSVKHFDAHYRGNLITRLHFKFRWYHRFRKQLFVQTVDMSQIEAIEKVAIWNPFTK